MLYRGIVFVFKELVWFTCRLLAPSLANKACILMYHSVSDRNNAFFTVTLENFERQLACLKKSSKRVVFLSDLIKMIIEGESIGDCVVLTFDDGYRDNYEIVFPMLKKYNFKASFFIPTGYVGLTMKNSEGIVLPVMNAKELIKVGSSEFVECLPHTHRHIDLSKKTIDESMRDINNSWLLINNLRIRSSKILAYPKGKFSKIIAERLALAGWMGAVTVCSGLVSSKSRLFYLPRNSVDKSTSLNKFKFYLSGGVVLWLKCKSWIWFGRY